MNELPYNEVIHWLYGAAWLILQSQDAFSIQWALLIPSILQKPFTLALTLSEKGATEGFEQRDDMMWLYHILYDSLEQSGQSQGQE